MASEANFFFCNVTRPRAGALYICVNLYYKAPPLAPRRATASYLLS